MSLKELLKQRKKIALKLKTTIESLEDYIGKLELADPLPSSPSFDDLELIDFDDSALSALSELEQTVKYLKYSIKEYVEVLNQVEYTTILFGRVVSDFKKASEEFRTLLKKEKLLKENVQNIFAELLALSISVKLEEDKKDYKIKTGFSKIYSNLVVAADKQFEIFIKIRKELETNQLSILKELEKKSFRTLDEFQKELDQFNKQFRGLKFSFVTTSQLDLLNYDLVKSKRKIELLREKQERENKNKNPKKEDFKKKLKEFEKLAKSGAKTVQQIRFFYDQILNLIPIRVLVEEGIRCLLKLLKLDEWVRQICKSALNSLSNDFVLNALIKLSYIQFSLSGDFLKKQSISKFKDGKLNPDYKSAIENRIALDANGLPVQNTDPKTGPDIVFVNMGMVNNFQKSFDFGAPSNQVDKYINLLRGVLSIKQVSLEKIVEIQKKDFAYGLAVDVAKKKLGEDLSQEADNRNNLLLRISETKEELADTLFELYDAQELCESLFDNVPEFAEAVLQFIMMFSWEELWKSAPAIPILKLPDFNFGIIDPNAKWDKVLKDTLARLGLELVSKLAGVMAQLLNQTCQNDLPGEVDIRTLNPIPLGELFPEYSDCAASLEKILDDLSLILTPSEICLLLEGEISAVTFPVNKDGFILNLHEYNVKEFARFETTTLTDLIERYAKQRYPKCSYIFGDPESILEFFKQFAEEAGGCPFPEKPRFFCEDRDEEELNKLRLEIFCDRYDQEQLDCLIEKTREMRRKRLAELMDSIYDKDFFSKFIPDVDAQLPIPTSTSFLIDNTLDTIFEVVKMNYDREIDSFIPAMIDYEGAQSKDKEGKATQKPFDFDKPVPAGKPKVAQNLKNRLDKDKKSKFLTYLDAISLTGFKLNVGDSNYITDGYEYDFLSNFTVFDFEKPTSPVMVEVTKSKQKVSFTGVEKKFIKENNINLLGSKNVGRDLFYELLSTVLSPSSIVQEGGLPREKEKKLREDKIIKERTFNVYLSDQQKRFNYINKNATLGEKQISFRLQGRKINSYEEWPTGSPNIYSANVRSDEIKSYYDGMKSRESSMWKLDKEITKIDTELSSLAKQAAGKYTRSDIYDIYFKLKDRYVKKSKEDVSNSKLFKHEPTGENSYFLPIQNVNLDPTPTPRQRAIKNCDVSILNTTRLKQDLKIKYLRFAKDDEFEKLLAETMVLGVIRVYIIDFLLRGLFATTSLNLQQNILGDDVVSEFLYGMFKYQLNIDLLSFEANDRVFVFRNLLKKAKRTYEKEFEGTTLFGEKLPPLDEEESFKFLFNRELSEIAERIPRVSGVGLDNLLNSPYKIAEKASSEKEPFLFIKKFHESFSKEKGTNIWKEGVVGLSLVLVLPKQRPITITSVKKQILMNRFSKKERELSVFHFQNIYEEELINRLRKTSQYTLMQKSLGFDQISAYLLSFNVMGISVDSQVSSVFSETRKSMIRIFRTAALENKDFTYQDPLVKNGVSANLRGGIDIGALILPLVLKAPIIVVKTLAEAVDPNAATTSIILKTAMAAVETAITVKEAYFSGVEAAGMVAEVTRNIATATGQWDSTTPLFRNSIEKAIKEKDQAIKGKRKREEEYDSLRQFINMFPAIIPGLALIPLGVPPTFITGAYWVADLAEKAIDMAAYENKKIEELQNSKGLKGEAEKARQMFIKKMKAYGIDVEAYEKLCQPERDSKKDDDKGDEEPKAPKPNKNPCD